MGAGTRRRQGDTSGRGVVGAVKSGEGAWVEAKEERFFLLYCSEVTEFVLRTNNVFLKKTTTTFNAETKQPTGKG